MGKLYILWITISIGFTIGTTDVTIEEESCLSKSANGTKSSSTVKLADNVTAEDIVPALFGAVTNVEKKSNNNETDKALVNDTRFQQPSIFDMLSRLNKPTDMKNDLTLRPILTVTDIINYKNTDETENKEKYGNPHFGQPILGITNRFAEKNNKINVSGNINKNNLLEDNIKNSLLNIIKTAREGNDQNKGQVKEAIVEMMNQFKNTTQNNEETTAKSKETAEPVVKSSKQVANTTEINRKSHISNGILSILHPVEIIHRVVDESEGPTPCTCGVFLSGQFKKGSKDQPKGEPLILQEMDTPFLNNVVGKRQCTNKCLEMVYGIPKYARLCSCSNSAKKGSLMKKFPKDPVRRKEWAIKMKRDNWKHTDSSCLCEIIKYIPKSSDIICATADRDIYKEKAYLFIKNFSNKWLTTNLSAGREFCCRDNTSYKCPLA